MSEAHSGDGYPVPLKKPDGMGNWTRAYFPLAPNCGGNRFDVFWWCSLGHRMRRNADFGQTNVPIDDVKEIIQENRNDGCTTPLSK
jgi:hypothetical protein